MPRTRLLALPAFLIMALLALTRWAGPVAAQLPPATHPAAAAVTAPFACSVAGFGSATGYTAGTHPQGSATADFNRDGNPDVAVTNLSSGTVSVALGTGSGGFGTATAFADRKSVV